MKKVKWRIGLLASALAFGPGFVAAQDVTDDQLVINGEIPIITEAPAPDHVDFLGTVRSGWTFRSQETQAMQADDFDNPGMLGVESAIAMFNTEMGSEGKSCASCHENPEGLRGVRATYPKWDEEHGQVQTVEMQVNECLTERMGAEEWKYTSGDMTNMSALISSVSRGLPVNVAIDGPAQSVWEQGKEIYYTRFGQLELSCANCHEDNYDNMIRADHLSQGQTNGFPTYRLKWGGLGSIHRRFSGCMKNIRATPFKRGSDEFIALELYLASRGAGLSVETPAVRN
jgi:sulfur-oxidizing protein SoxA